MRIPTEICQIDLNEDLVHADHLTEKSGWGVESIMVSYLLVCRRGATSVTV